MFEDLKERYRREGFCVAKGILPTELINTGINDFREVLRQQLNRFEILETGTLQLDMQQLLKRDQAAYLSVLRLSAKLPQFRRIMSRAEIESACKKLGCNTPTVSASPVFHVMSDNLKIEGGYFGFEPHQDWPSIQGALDGIVAWAPLLPVTINNFPMELVPGSHESGLMTGEITPNLYKVESSNYAETDFVPIEAEPGDVVFMSFWTVHRTKTAGCEGFRLALSNRWEDASEPTFVERNYPCAYKNSVQREWITEGFPQKHEVISALDRIDI
jgi:ectoine hydroxylase-related dioxygenase (phytanoyl-CoA dioxygenase family)